MADIQKMLEQKKNFKKKLKKKRKKNMKNLEDGSSINLK